MRNSCCDGRKFDSVNHEPLKIAKQGFSQFVVKRIEGGMLVILGYRYRGKLFSVS